MKRYIYLFVILVLGISCEPDLLEEHAKGRMSPDVFYSSDQMPQAADYLSSEFADVFSQAGCVGIHMGADDISTLPGANKEKFREMDLFSTTGDNDRIRLWWDNLYHTIRSANAIIDNIDKSTLSQAETNDVLGTAYFYRAMSYSFLTRLFGEIPLVTEFSTSADLNIPRSSVTEVYAVITDDLIKAEKLLPRKRPEKTSEPGGYPGAKPCKGTVKSLMSQVYLTMAGWPLKQTSNYALAAKKAKEVIDSADFYGYELQPNIFDLWTWENNYTNTEIIYGCYYNENGKLSMHGPLGGRPEEYQHPTVGWAIGWSDYLGEISFFKRFPSGPRKDATYQTVINIRGIGDVPWDDPRTNQQHPYIRKYQEEFPGSSWVGARTNQVIRYAEILLNYAEAQDMADGAPNAGAYDAINAVRNRAGLPDLTPGLSGMDFRDSVIVERGWEFAGGEAASRWFDLIRTETLEKATLLRDTHEIPLPHQPTKADYWLAIPDVDVAVTPSLQ